MRNDCARYAEDLVRLAEGNPEPLVEHHVAACSQCAAKLGELQRVIQLAAIPHYAAPDSVASRAKGLMPVRRRTYVASLLKSSLATSGARSLPENSHLVVGTEEYSIRLMVERHGEKLQILGELPAEDWLIESEKASVTKDGKRFRLLCSKPGDSAFAFERDDVRVEVPSLEDLVANGTGNPG